MIKKFCLLLILIITMISNAQDIIFQPNVNRSARLLKQSLNETRDSLLLESTETISQVDFLNDDFLESFDINSNKTQIDLKQLPIGDFVIQARVKKKRIVMYLKKTGPLEIPIVENPIVDTNKTISKKRKDKKRKKTKEVQRYWVVYESNSGFGSKRKMSLENKERLEELVSKAKLEINTNVGKHNKLVVYEVYNTSKFMRKQLRNRQYYKSKKSKFFNAKPIYSIMKNDSSETMDSKS